MLRDDSSRLTYAIELKIDNLYVTSFGYFSVLVCIN